MLIGSSRTPWSEEIFSMVSSASHRGAAIQPALIRLGFSALLTTAGMFVIFDVFGIASHSREANFGVTKFGRWLNAKWEIPDPYTVVAWIFIAVGSLFFIVYLIKVLVAV